MSMSEPTYKHIALLETMAAERGKSIPAEKMPTTSSGVSALIRALEKLPSLPVTEAQIEEYRTVVAECVARVPNFQVGRFAEVPEDRSSANKAIYALNRLLAGVEFRETLESAESIFEDVSAA